MKLVKLLYCNQITSFVHSYSTIFADVSILPTILYFFDPMTNCISIYLTVLFTTAESLSLHSSGHVFYALEELCCKYLPHFGSIYVHAGLCTLSSDYCFMDKWYWSSVDPVNNASSFIRKQFTCERRSVWSHYTHPRCVFSVLQTFQKSAKKNSWDRFGEMEHASTQIWTWT